MAASATTDEVLTSTLESRPDVLEHLTAAHAAAQAAVDIRLYELCRIRVASLLGTPLERASGVLDDATIAALSRWPTSDLFDDRDRACLAFTEQFVIDVASLDDAHANAVVSQLGGAGFANFVNALLVIEQRQRLRLAWDRLFEGQQP